MYIFMLSCYLLMIINFINFTISGAMVFFDIQFFGANHAQFSLLAILVFVLTETIVMYFFIATGKSIKNILIENNWDFDSNQLSIIVSDLFDKVDVDGNGKIDFDEFFVEDTFSSYKEFIVRWICSPNYCWRSINFCRYVTISSKPI